MNNEQKLLTEILEKADEKIADRLLNEKIDWEYFRQIVAQHRLAPLVFDNLRARRAAVQIETFESLREMTEKIALKNLELNAGLLKIAHAFEQADIEYVAYKGATLAQIAYGNPSLRQFGDLDLLIGKENFGRVKKLITETGGLPAWNLTEKQEKAVLKHYYEYPFVFGENRLLVEIHWSFMESFFGFDYDTREVFRRSRKVAVYNQEIRTLSNEDLLLVLCVHGSKHFWKRLSWICDVGKLVANQPLDWDLIVSLAAGCGCLRMLYLGLGLAGEFLKIKLPVEIERAIRNAKEIEFLVEKVKKNLFDGDHSSENLRVRLHLKMRERWRDKLIYSRRLLTTRFVDSLFMPMGRPR